MRCCLILLFISVTALAQTPKLKLELVASGLNRPNDIAVLSASEFLVSQTDGKIRLVRNGVVQSTLFLDLSTKIYDPTWEGIFGITLHPNYAANGYIYVHYSNSILSSVFARYTRKATNPDQADPASELIILTIPYATGGHRSGRIGFGPDGYLYITTGDSSPGARGSIGDPNKLAQNLSDLHGKLLRIDVNSGRPYSIPATNPFASPTDGVPDEIYGLGLRNPWRWSFDRQTGDFWLGDVGQDGWEELNFTAANTPAPQNYGWPCYEGSHAYNATCPTNATYHMPLLDYAGYNSGRDASITGGFVYRGTNYLSLRGWYVYGDYSRGIYWTVKREASGTYQAVQQAITISTNPVSFGEGADGELYVISLSDGKLYRITVETIRSVQSGNWATPATWSCTCLPTANDEVTISRGHTIAVDQSKQVKALVVNGSLVFSHGGKVSF